MIHQVSRSWYETGPRTWPVDPIEIQAGRGRRAVLWETRLLVAIVVVIYLALELVQLLLGGSP